MSDYTVGYGLFADGSSLKNLQKLLTKDVVDILEEQQEWWICIFHSK